MNHIVEAAARARIRDCRGHERELRDLWQTRPIVIAFVRHFACLHCRHQVTQLRREIANIHRLGAELVIVSNGSEQFAAAFREDLGLETPLFVDPTRASYRALGMKRGVIRTLGAWRTWVNLGRAFIEGVRQRRTRVILGWWNRSVTTLIPGTQGDAWQLGGVLVVLPDGRVPYRYLSNIAGDHPPPTEVVAALEAATR